MRVLYHYPLCPFSRKIRFLLAEKCLDIALETEKFWEERDFFLNISPLGQFPVLKDIDGSIFLGSVAISEYLEEAYPEISFLHSNIQKKAEIRRLCHWFESSFAQDISMNLFIEKYLKFQNHQDECVSPNAEALRHIRKWAREYFDYFNEIVHQRYWLAGDIFSLADITAASHISIVDYFGDIVWAKHPMLKAWYARVKSRPTFRQFLTDRLPGSIPSLHYEDLDF